MKRNSSHIRRDQVFFRRMLAVVAVGALLAALWVLSEVILLVFGSVLVAVMLRALAAPLTARAAIPDRWALALAGVLLLLLLASIVIVFGADLAQQLRGLADRLSVAVKTLGDQLRIVSIADFLKGENPASTLGSIAARVVAWSTTLLGVATGLLLVIFGGIYLALDPAMYRIGLLKLIPPPVQANVAAALDDAGEALRRWLGAQVLAMILVGTLTGIGFWLIGLPSPLALGLVAGLAEFVPIVGPLAAAIPALLLAAVQGWQSMLWAVGVIIVVQQLENNVIAPLVVGRSVAVAPAVALYAIISMGVLLGPLGLLFGFPLAIVFDVAVRRLYIHDTLGERVEVLGQPAK